MIHTKYKKGCENMNLCIDWKNLTLFEMLYILSNKDGYIDGDKQSIIIEV